MRIFASASILFSLVIAQVGCGAESSGESYERAESGMVAEMPNAAVDGGPVSNVDARGGEEVPTQRQIIYTATVYATVDDVMASQREVATIAEELGGYVEAASGEDMDSRTASYNLTIRVPAQSYETAMSRIYKIGTVYSENRNVEDVTRQLVDLEARLKTLRAEENSLNTLLSRADEMEDIIKLTDRLQSVRENIEMAMGRQKTLRTEVAMATINVRLSQSPTSLATEESDPNWLANTWANATTALVTLARGLAQVGIWLLVMSPIWLPILLVAYWLIRRSIRYTNTPGSSGAASPGPPPPSA
jgi:hypothetical protein